MPKAFAVVNSVGAQTMLHTAEQDVKLNSDLVVYSLQHHLQEQAQHQALLEVLLDPPSTVVQLTETKFVSVVYVVVL